MDRTQFAWSRPEKGYRWVSGAELDPDTGETPWEPTGRYLVGEDSALRWAHPLTDTPELFIRFAALNPSEDEILEFANDFGALGVPVYRDFRANSKWIRGEPLSAWITEIHHMSRALEIWHALSGGDAAKLASHFVLDVKGVYFAPNPRRRRPLSERDWIAKRDHGLDLMGELEVGHPFTAAQLWLQLKVNRVLEKRVSAIVLPKSSVGFSNPGLFIIPSTLLSALWLQFAQMMTLNHELRSCPECGVWFEIAPDAARANRIYCRDACKSRAYRTRLSDASPEPSTRTSRRAGPTASLREDSLS